MKVKCTIDLDLETGDYQVLLNNISSPGEDVDYSLVKKMLQDVVQDDWIQIADTDDEDTPSQIH